MPAGKNKSSPAAGATLPSQFAGLLKAVGGWAPVHVTCVAAKAMVGTLRPDSNNAASKRTETKRDDDFIKFDLDTQGTSKRVTRLTADQSRATGLKGILLLLKDLTPDNFQDQ